jgi:hypothetical protein
MSIKDEALAVVAERSERVEAERRTATATLEGELRAALGYEYDELDVSFVATGGDPIAFLRLPGEGDLGTVSVRRDGGKRDRHWCIYSSKGLFIAETKAADDSGLRAAIVRGFGGQD